MNNFDICRGHFPAQYHYRHCMAKAMQRRLKRLGYTAAQFQGVISTDAERGIIDEQIAIMEDSRTDWARG